jgi:DNA-binding transcriptional ArsR family regulator
MPFEPTDTFWIDDEETLELLADATRLEIIELVMVPRSVSEIADEMGVPRTRLYHHVKLLEEAGLIVVADTRKAGAMTERIYRAAAEGYRPSAKFLESARPRAQAEATLASIFGSTRADFVRAVDQGIVSFGDPRDARRASLSRRLMRLTPEHLHEFITELEALVDRYGNDEGDDTVVVAALHAVYPSSRRIR